MQNQLNLSNILFCNSGEHLSDGFKEINRFKKLPCITDDDFKLSESVAILRYLDTKYSIPEELYPNDPKQRARIDEYLEWQHLNTRLGCANAFRIQVIQPLLTGKAPNPNVLKPIIALREQALQSIEDIWLADNNYIVGDKLTVADLFAACEIEQTSKKIIMKYAQDLISKQWYFFFHRIRRIRSLNFTS